MENNDKVLFSSFVKINYDDKFIKPVQNFVSQIAIIAGANEKESFELKVLIEEVLFFIINKYIDSRFDAHIEIRFYTYKDGRIVMEMTDIGPPINENKIPEFNFNDENTESGLWFKLVRNLSDKFEFINQFNEGWLIKFEKKIKYVDVFCIEKDIIEADTKGKKIIRQATGKDAIALVDLAFMTYRYSNGIHEFYDAKQLEKHINDKLYDIFVVEHNQKIIGAISVKYPQLNARSGEVSSAMVAPEYRNSTAIRLIMKQIIEYHKENPRNCDFFVSYAVTTHDRSQKLLSKVYKGYKPLSLSLNMILRPEYIGLKDKTFSRETLANYYHLYNSLNIKSIYILDRHYEIIDEIINNTGNQIQLLTNSEDIKTDNSKISHFVLDEIKSAIIFLERVGNDWFLILTKKIIFLIGSGIETILLNINTENPLPQNMGNELLSLNFFFSGLYLYSLDKLYLLYSFSTREIDFDSIKLESPILRKLLLQIENDYNKVKSS